MKLAFSTLGCPDWTWDEIFATAKDIGIDGIEVRGIGKELYAPDMGLFAPQRAAATMERLRQANMAISAFTSGASLGLPDSREQAVPEVRGYLALAARTGVPYVRVLVSPTVEPGDCDLTQAKELYQQLSAEAAALGVCLLIETNGPLCDSAAMARFLEGCDPQGSGVLWDVHHPYRFCGEAPELTYRRLGDRIRYLHVKDSVMKDGKVAYRMMGHGDVPVFDALKLLHDGGYDGFVTLEWVKRWNKELQEPGLVFYHFGTYMEYLLKQL
ncbi:MAG: sugar phosphate isomerase/epimerase [Angelakisella sp.]